MLRSPSFQEELSNFLQKYPVVFCFRRKLLRSYGSEEKETTRRWENLLERCRKWIEKVRQSGDTTYYKYVVRSPFRPTELEILERSVRHFELQQWRSVNEASGKFPRLGIFSRVLPFIADVPWMPGDRMNPQYHSLADCTEQDFVRDEARFSAKWNVFPHHISAPREPIIVFHDQIKTLDPDVQLFIPVSEFLTKEELERRWREVASMQSVIYRKKRRPNRTPFEILIEIYDRWGKSTKAELAKNFSVSQSSIEKYYRRVYIDIHHSRPTRKVKKDVRLQRRRKTRLGFVTISATQAAAPSEHELLRRIYIENDLPPSVAPDRLSKKDREILRHALRSQNQERRRMLPLRKAPVR
jgi:hypothetical protein